jgi:hypothetical protein
LRSVQDIEMQLYCYTGRTRLDPRVRACTYVTLFTARRKIIQQGDCALLAVGLRYQVYERGNFRPELDY